MKILKKIGLGFLVVLILANIAVVLSGNNHLYKGLADTYLQGRTKPSIDDPDIFYTRILKSKSPRAWEESKSKNSVSLSHTLQFILTHVVMCFTSLKKQPMQDISFMN